MGKISKMIEYRRGGERDAGEATLPAAVVLAAFVLGAAAHGYLADREQKATTIESLDPTSSIGVVDQDYFDQDILSTKP
jgi:hypothetical protein